MDKRDDQVASLTGFPPIPSSGLTAVLASWVGRGSLFEALSVPTEDREVREWASSDVRLRANRILLTLLDPHLGGWPKRASEWLDYLPASKTHTRVIEQVPFSGVAWAESRRRFGWPPTAFIGKNAERGADMLAVQVLRWCADRLAHIWIDGEAVQQQLRLESMDQLLSVLKLLELEPLSSASPGVPTRADLIALKREGSPWGGVATVAQILMEADNSIDYLVYQVLMPDDQMRWRLFHLAILGVLLSSLREVGCQITSLRPLSPKSSGPNYEVVSPRGELYLLWFEASGVWSHFGKSSPFIEATRGIGHARRSNGADLLLLMPDRRALVLECKYSWNQDVVARDGYYQAMAYGAEVRSRLADNVVSAAVGPESVVSVGSFSDLSIGRVGTIPPSGLSSLVDDFVNDQAIGILRN
ncbi:hypothetical protein OKW18_002835 [Streptomyces pratensis]|jgi:hypothetical protein|nr:hypothetical protein [Streptomyces pratensis]